MAAARREFSAGGVIYKKTGADAKVALIAKKAKTVWCLPKGKIEKGETAEQAALREIEEETGLRGKLITHLGDITYWYASPVDKARVFKKVRFFLFEYSSGSLGSSDIEIDEAGWFTTSDALRMMAFPSERKIMKKAEGMIEA